MRTTAMFAVLAATASVAFAGTCDAPVQLSTATAILDVLKKTSARMAKLETKLTALQTGLAPLSSVPGIMKMQRAAPQFKNGNFETSGYSTNAYKYVKPNGWTGKGGCVLAKNGNRPWGGLDSGDGSYYYSIQSDGSYLQQKLTLVKGAQYTVRFLATHRPGYGSDEKLRVKINTATGAYTDIFHRDYMPEKFMEFSATFTALRTDTTFRFENDSPRGDRSVFIDQIRIY